MQDDPVVLVVTVSASITGNRILYLMHEIVEILILKSSAVHTAYLTKTYCLKNVLFEVGIALIKAEIENYKDYFSHFSILERRHLVQN